MTNRADAVSRRRRPRPPTASEQLEALLGYPWPFLGRPPKHDLTTWTVTDDLPHPVPVAEAEIDVFERWFGDLFDELFGAEARSGPLPLSDRKPDRRQALKAEPLRGGAPRQP